VSEMDKPYRDCLMGESFWLTMWRKGLAALPTSGSDDSGTAFCSVAEFDPLLPLAQGAVSSCLQL